MCHSWKDCPVCHRNSPTHSLGGIDEMLTRVLVSGPEKADGIGLLPQECATTKMGRKSIHSRLRRWLRHECRRALRLGRG